MSSLSMIAPPPPPPQDPSAAAGSGLVRSWMHDSSHYLASPPLADSGDPDLAQLRSRERALMLAINLIQQRVQRRVVQAQQQQQQLGLDDAGYSRDETDDEIDSDGNGQDDSDHDSGSGMNGGNALKAVSSAVRGAARRGRTRDLARPVDILTDSDRDSDDDRPFRVQVRPMKLVASAALPSLGTRSQPRAAAAAAPPVVFSQASRTGFAGKRAWLLQRTTGSVAPLVPADAATSTVTDPSNKSNAVDQEDAMAVDSPTTVIATTVATESVAPASPAPSGGGTETDIDVVGFSRAGSEEDAMDVDHAPPLRIPFTNLSLEHDVPSKPDLRLAPSPALPGPKSAPLMRTEERPRTVSSRSVPDVQTASNPLAPRRSELVSAPAANVTSTTTTPATAMEIEEGEVSSPPATVASPPVIAAAPMRHGLPPIPRLGVGTGGSGSSGSSSGAGTGAVLHRAGSTSPPVLPSRPDSRHVYRSSPPSGPTSTSALVSPLIPRRASGNLPLVVGTGTLASFAAVAVSEYAPSSGNSGSQTRGGPSPVVGSGRSSLPPTPPPLPQQLGVLLPLPPATSTRALGSAASATATVSVVTTATAMSGGGDDNVNALSAQAVVATVIAPPVVANSDAATSVPTPQAGPAATSTPVPDPTQAGLDATSQQPQPSQPPPAAPKRLSLADYKNRAKRAAVPATAASGGGGAAPSAFVPLIPPTLTSNTQPPIAEKREEGEERG
ncbi:hypothetical protein BC828DRAFT_385330 [Blastocladiella britannica]|nr:hypothetical protein BC828DRAFT_385330 [Blastocladiella britannica]